MSGRFGPMSCILYRLRCQILAEISIEKFILWGLVCERKHSRLRKSQTLTAEKQNAKLLKAWRFVLFVVPAKGVEPSTFALQVRCSTN